MRYEFIGRDGARAGIVVLGAMLAPLAAGGVGDCCNQNGNGSPGCDDDGCEALVCAADAFCCESEWDGICAGIAIDQCTLCGGDPGDCCEANNTPGCNDPECQAFICMFDPFCCDVGWDDKCMASALQDCAVCEPMGACCLDGACTEGTAGACAGMGGVYQGDDTVCGPDSCPLPMGACCSDGACAVTTEDACAASGGVYSGDGTGCDPNECPQPTGACCFGTTCQITTAAACFAGGGDYNGDDTPCTPALCSVCPGQGDCCEPHGSPGCDDAECCELVCTQDPFCCENKWDVPCAEAADAQCAVCEPDCCIPGGNGTPGCNDPVCEALICAQDPFCCDNTWDTICSNAAIELCEVCQGLCPGAGDCCVPNGSPGCNDAECCELICAQAPFCCDAEWDTVCASSAVLQCQACLVPTGACCLGVECAELTEAICMENDGVYAGDGSVCEAGSCDPPCPGDGDCCVNNGTPGCNDAACCELVCAADPFCCEETWDSVCAGVALNQCDACLGAPCVGDLDGDGDTDSADLNILLGDFGCTSGCAGDLDRDDDTDSGDLNILLGDFECGTDG